MTSGTRLATRRGECSRSVVGRELGEDLADGVLQDGEVALHDKPNDLEVDLEVAVDEHIAEGGYSAPVDFGLARLCLIAQTLRSLTEDLRVAKDGVLESV